MTSSGWARPTGGRSRSAPGTHVRDHISGCAGADGCWGRSQAGTEDERGDGRGEDDGAHSLNYVPYTTSSPAEHAPYFEPACPVPTGASPVLTSPPRAVAGLANAHRAASSRSARRHVEGEEGAHRRRVRRGESPEHGGKARETPVLDECSARRVPLEPPAAWRWFFAKRRAVRKI